MSKKQQVIDYLLNRRKGDIVTVRRMRYDLSDNGIYAISRATILAAFDQLRDDGWADKWGGGRSTRWYIREKQRD